MTTAIYTRQSLDRTGNEAGVERQLTECQELAKNHELVVAYELSDNDISATSGKVRPDFEKLLKLVKAGKVDTVISWHTDRLYRTLKDLARIVEIAKETGLTITTVQAGIIDLSTPSGRLTAGVLGSAATYEGEHRTARQQSAYKDLAALGVWHFSHRPFGYRREDGTQKPVVVPSEAAILRELFQRYGKGESRHALVKDLNARGIKTATGKSWTITQLRSVLSNERYAGISSYMGKEVGNGNWVPIITRKEWVAYTGNASVRKVTNPTFSRTATSLLSGLARCAVCKGKLYQRQRNDAKKTKEYACWENHCVSTTAEPLNELATNEVISALILGPRNIVAVDGEHNTTTITEALFALQAEKKAQHRLVEIKQAVTADIVPTLARINAEMNELTKRLEEITKESVAAELLLGLKSDLFSGTTVSIEDAATLKGQITQRFEKIPLERQRSLTAALIEVSVGRGRGTDRVHIQHLEALGLNDDVDPGEMP